MAYRARGRTHINSSHFRSYNSPGYGGYALGSRYGGLPSSVGYGGSSNTTVFISGNRSDGWAPIKWNGKACLYIVVIPTFIFVSIFIFTGSVLGVVLGATSSSSSSPRLTRDPSVVTLSPGVTRSNVSFGNAFFCNEVTMEVNGSNRTGASVYLITDTPPLTHRNTITRTNNLIISVGSVRTWNRRLYSSSNVTISLYIHRTPSSGTLYVYQGISNFNSDRSFTFFLITCTIGYTHRVSFRVQHDDDYYFVYRGRSFGCELFTIINSQFQLNISASWFVHSTANLTNAPNCSASNVEECSLNVPADRNYRALVVTDLSTINPDLSDTTRIRLQCSSARGWAYAVVVLVPLLLVIGVTITTVILLVVCCKKRATCCSQHNTQTTTTTTAPTSAVQLQEMSPQDTQPAPASVTDEKDNKTTSDLTAAPPPSYKDSLDYPAQKTADLPPEYYS